MSIPKKYNKDFFKKWSSDMAYVLGFMYADGNIVQTQRGGHYIAIYSSDQKLLESMKKVMKSKHKISLRKETSGHVYRIQIGSKEWFTDLGRLGLVTNKTSRMLLPDIPEQFLGDFVRGYFDGDGNVWVGLVHKERKIPLKTIQVAFTSGSSQYLKSLQGSLIKRGLRGGSLYIPKTKNFARLAFSVKDTSKLYEIMYNTPHELYLKRKKVIFERFMKLRS